MSVSHDSDRGTVLPAQRARQGVTGHNVRYVLGFGLVGIIVAFAVPLLDLFWMRASGGNRLFLRAFYP